MKYCAFTRKGFVTSGSSFFLAYSNRKYINQYGDGYLVGLFNIASMNITPKSNDLHWNIIDGVVLVETMRFAIQKGRTVYNSSIGYRIFDLEDSISPLSSTHYYYYYYPHISAVTSRQISHHISMRKTNTYAPLISVFPQETEGNQVYSIVPPKSVEIKAIIDILVHLNWKHVSVVASFNNEAKDILDGLLKLANESGICIDKEVWIDNIPTNNELQRIVKKLKGNALVIILLTNSVGTRAMLQSNLKEVTFVTGTSLRANEIEKTTAKRIIMLQHSKTYDEDFKDYFMNLSINSTTYSWFKEFWSQTFQCNVSSFISSKSYDNNCTGQEKLTENVIDLKHAIVRPMIKAVQTIVCAMKLAKDEFMKQYCAVYDRRYFFYRYYCIYGYYQRHSLFRRNIAKNIVNCSFNSSIGFNKDDYFNWGYDILSFDGKILNTIGSWRYNDTQRKQLNFTVNWKTEKSSCHQTCKVGEIEELVASRPCCNTCKICNIYDIVKQGTCIPCLKFETPDVSRSQCLRLPRIFISSQRKSVLAMQLFACLGVFATIFTICIFIKHRNSRVVKSTGHEVSSIILVSINVCFTSSLIFFLQPTLVVCGLQKILLGQCLSACYIPLLLKTIRVYRVFEASKKLIRNPTLVSAKSQILLCFLGILANLLLGFLLVISQPPKVKATAIEGYTKVAVHCNHNPMDAVTCLVPCLILLFACTYFGYKTRQFPSNFNESFRISITMYISCFLWGIYIPLQYLFQNNKQNVFMTNFITAGLMIILAFVNLIGIFGTTVIKVIKKNEINNEIFVASSSFHTMRAENATNVTCTNEKSL